MHLNDGQSFLDLYYQAGTVEVASGSSQTNLTQGRGNDVRNSGQVSTPDSIADAMAEWVLAKNPRKVLDPAAGLGHLLHACARNNSTCRMVGIESDHEVFKEALSTAPKGAKLILTDYLHSNPGLFEGIIANPPYVKSQRLGMSEAEWQYFDELFGIKLGRQTNLYALFLLKIWEDLAPSGRAAVIIPAEFLNANFGRVIKESLQKMRPRGLAVFDPEVNLFENTLTTSVVLFLEKSVASCALRTTLVKSTNQLADFVSSLERHSDLQQGETDFSKIAPAEKWLNRIFNKPDGESCPLSNVSLIGDFFRCSRGIATGANDYFCLRHSDIEREGLSEEDFDRCVTKAADLSSYIVDEAGFSRLSSADKRCYLLNPTDRSKQVEAYLEYGISLNVPQRHLPSKRPVWYLPEKTQAAAILVPVFTRGQPRYLLNQTSLKNLTCFHGIYPKPGFEKYVPLAWIFLNSTRGFGAFQAVNRFYGNGLNKLEPKDVEQIDCPDFRVCDETIAKIERKIALRPKNLDVSWFDMQVTEFLPVR